MNSLITRLLYCIIGLMGCVYLTAQEYPFVYYTPRDGLVNSRVRGIMQDSRGRMYFFTYGGLSVYDGVAFKNYRQQDGLGNELVNDVIEISPDSFLIATNASALNTLVHGKIGNHITSDNFYPVINKFLKSNDGDLYFVADDGLFKLIDNKFSRIPLLDKEGTEIGYNLNAVTEWDRYLLLLPWYFSQKENLIVYDKEKRVVVGSITEKFITSIAITPAGEIWLSSTDGIQLLDKTSLQKGIVSLSPFPYDNSIRKWFNAHIYADDNGDIWIYTLDKVLYLSSSGEQQLLSTAQGLKINSLSNLLVDREGNTWMASDGNGVVKMSGRNVQVLGALVPGIRNNVFAIHQQSDTTWLFNLTDNSFYRIHNKHLTSFPLGLGPVTVNNIYIDGEALYCTADQKLYRIENKNQSASYKHPVQIPLYSPHAVHLGIGLAAPNGVIIQSVRSDSNTSYLVVLKNGEIQMSEELSFSVDQFALYQPDFLWVPTRDNHLRRYSLHPEFPSRYLHLEYDFSKEIAGIEPRSSVVDTTGNIWIGTRNKGIYRLQLEENLILSSLQFTTLQGLTDNFLTYLYCDPDNNIWAGSWTGLDKISFKDGEFFVENITKSKNIFLGIAKIANVEDDVIWALTTSGDIIRISTAVTGKAPPMPSLFISSLVVNDQVYDTSKVIFDHDQNNFSIGVAAPSFIDEKSIQYSFQLQGSGEGNWIKPSNDAHFNFINLTPGVYTLNIKAEFPAKMYPEQSLKYAFTIRPPYWQTWWFLSLVSLLVIAFLGLIVRYYYARKLEKQRMILEKKQAVEKERTRIATDMHDDLGAGLSRIKFLSETIGIKKQRHQPIEEEITNIRHYAHEMIDKMGEIVWALNEKNDSLSDLLSYTRAYVMEYLAENGLQGNIEKLPPMKIISVNGEFRRNIYLSVKETLHNIIKHARANTVSMDFEATDVLMISIQDDGVGFDPQDIRPFRNGLTNIRKRMSEIGGELQIINDHGTRIVLTAPLPS